MQNHLAIISISLILIGLITVSINNEIVEAAPVSITVYSPSNGAKYYEGNIISITWDYSEIGNYVKIELLRGGSLIYTISSNTSNDRSYPWAIPSGYASDYSYIIRITDLEQPYYFGDSGYFYIYETSIIVTSPANSDVWFKNSYYTIQWSSENTGNYIRIELYKSGSYYSTISSSTYNDGLHSWLISSSISSSSDYQIKITSITDSSTFDFSGYFSISERSITITTPSGGETWYKGETKTIKWTSESADNFVSIHYKQSSTYSWSTIVSSTSNTGNYQWTLPLYVSLGNQYQIKISSISYSNVYDISNYFTIDERYIHINSPNRYDTWYPNETYTISWTSKNIESNVDIRLVKNDVHIAWISTNHADIGSYSWTISDVFASDSTYQIEIRSKQYNNVHDLSDMFSIGKRSIQITLPKSEITFYIGEYCNIEWDTEDSGNNVKIELYKDGKFYKTIDSNVSNSGTYSWKIPTELPESTSYQIKVVSSAYSDVYGYSAGNFTIAQTFIQKISLPILVIVTVIVVISVSTMLIIKNRKKNVRISNENDLAEQQFLQTQVDQTKVTQEEYDDIWENKNLYN